MNNETLQNHVTGIIVEGQIMECVCLINLKRNTMGIDVLSHVSVLNS